MKHRILTMTVLLAAGMAGSREAARATIYTSDPNIADQTADIGEYATFSNFSSGDVGSPFTPTATELANNGYRVYNGGTLPGLPGSDWILATFSNPVSAIRVFPNIDHFGSQYDGYQYSIYGSNDGVSWTSLFDALTVNGGGEPFTLGTFSGTAPLVVNNVLTPGAGPSGIVGYEADFSFGSAYSQYAFGASTVASDQGNTDQELSAVGSKSVPDGLPGGTSALLIAGFGMLRLFARCCFGKRS